MPKLRINAKKLRLAMDDMVEKIPTRSMYDTVLTGMADVYDALELAKGEKNLADFEKKLANARVRLAWYQNYVATGEDREAIHLALFHDDSSKTPFKVERSDAETPWHLINELSRHVNLDANAFVKTFWENTSTRLSAFAQEGPEGRRFGFWPIVARTAPTAARALWPVAAGALVGASAYSATQAEKSETYLESAQKYAGSFGVGLAFGAAAALLLIASRN